MSSLEIELAKKTITVIFSDKALETSLTNTKSYLSSLEIELAKKTLDKALETSFISTKISACKKQDWITKA